MDPAEYFKAKVLPCGFFGFAFIHTHKEFKAIRRKKSYAMNYISSFCTAFMISFLAQKFKFVMILHNVKEEIFQNSSSVYI